MVGAPLASHCALPVRAVHGGVQDEAGRGVPAGAAAHEVDEQLAAAAAGIGLTATPVPLPSSQPMPGMSIQVQPPGIAGSPDPRPQARPVEQKTTIADTTACIDGDRIAPS